MLTICLCNAAVFYSLVLSGEIHTALIVPLSLPIAAMLAWILRCIHAARSVPLRSSGRAARWVVTAVLAGAILLSIPLAQMFCFGKTDYRRNADVIVVFGAGVYADGSMSLALADRMRTAIRLHKQGYAEAMVFSGGPGQGSVHETEAMRRMAIEHGIEPEAIFLDRNGLNTRATVANTCAMFDRTRWRRVLAVSHFYHLPRIKMAYQRAGLEVFTVPAKETRPLNAMGYFIAREAAAWWAYYLRPLAA